MQKSESIVNLVKALLAAQSQFDPILKDKDNPFFRSKYADLAGVINATQPTLIKNGLLITQFPVSEEGRVGVLTILAHTSGEFISDFLTLPLAKQDAQTGVAAVTYARRTSYLGVIGVAAEDDDGNTASGHAVEKSVSKRTTRQVIAEERELISDAPEPPSAPNLLITPAPTGTVPTTEELDKYRDFVVNLTQRLSASGELKASRDKRVSSKVLSYLLKCTGASDAAQITTTQWETLVAAIKEIEAKENGLKELAKLIEKTIKEK